MVKLGTPTAAKPRYAVRREARLPRRDRPLAVPQIQLLRPRDLLLRILQHLLPLGEPAGHPRHRKQHREEADREAEGLVDDPGVEVHVRVEPAPDEVVLLERHPLEFERDVDPRVLAR